MSKINRFSIFLLIMLFSMASIAIASEKHVSPDKLPSYVKQFVGKYFASARIIEAERKLDHYGDEKIEIELDNGISIDFYRGEWWEIDGNGIDVNRAYIPAPIRAYVKKNCPGRIIKEISKNRIGYHVELDGDEDIMFSKECTLINHVRD